VIRFSEWDIPTMRRLRLSLYIPARITVLVQEGEEQTAQDLVDALSVGLPPAWLESEIRKVLEEVPMERIEVDEFEILGHDPEPDEELDFDDQR
jgi:hypothetical protein